MSNYQGRPLGAVEKLYLALNDIFTKDFALVAELDRKVPPGHIPAAMGNLIRRHPQLNYHIKEDSRFQFWFRCGPEPSIPYRIVEVDEFSDWLYVLKSEMMAPVQTDTPPMIRIIFLQKAGTSTVIILANHTIADGMAGLIILQDLLKILSGYTLAQLKIPGSIDVVVGEILENQPVFIPGAGEPVKYPDPGSETEIFINKLQLTGAFTSRLLGNCRREKTTINGALNAAVALVLNANKSGAEDRPIITRAPLSVRELLSNPQDVVLNVITRNMALQPADFPGIWPLARFISNELRSPDSLDEVKAYVKYFRAGLMRPVPFSEIVKTVRSSVDTDFMITNLGRINQDIYGSYKILNLWGPVVVSGTGKEQTIGTVTIAGRLTLTHVSLFPVRSLLSNAVDLIMRSLP
ncbi:hypothetical protein ACFQZI_07035 [Mucilaginibacter lutimaris]|uniref:Condensation domain-containing protein n=1 Tax=Mucilaginibacter lutimaris TaxID=931629 RepID=A0ABW2ZEJ3_9SPHI